MNRALATSKQECDNAEVQLQDLQARNDAVVNEDWENKLKAIQESFEN